MTQLLTVGVVGRSLKENEKREKIAKISGDIHNGHNNE